ncbi:cathepsin B-like proteinase [Ectocarpus siliculosus]|uniref:Cathepsin B-like proteinase n=1 Tax=Ectocarpus siliculosus TaxID=2880 RepID=D8LG82_ECTSI|nr:cathepsin B-like proteinase [Ectocarpus siliculosus]|eukprot:CBN78981.1 cathepsin B-like proteinase [Ectocarpus siliculosus]
MKFFGGALAAGLVALGSANADHRCKDAPKDYDAALLHVSRSDWNGRRVSGYPVSFEISGVAESSAKPFIDAGDFVLHVEVTGETVFRMAGTPTDATSPGGLTMVYSREAGRAEFELDLCTDVAGVRCPLQAGDRFSGVATWNAFVLPERGDENAVESLTTTVITAVQPDGPACGQFFTFHDVAGKEDASATLLEDHLSELVESDESSRGPAASSWSRGYSSRFEGFSWKDARRIAGGTVMRGQVGFEELPRRRYTKEIAPAVPGRRRLTPVAQSSSDEDIPANFDAREAFPECASIIGRVRDQSDCGSCWAFASTEAFNDRRCIAGIGKEDAAGAEGEATADQLLVLSAEDTTACCHGFHCGLSMGCNGGQPGSAWKWFTKTGVVTGGDYADIGTGTTCKPYEFMPCAHHVDPGASGYPACPDGEYPTPECLSECSETNFSGGSYGEDKKMAREAYSLAGIENIQRDMMKYGSVTAAFSVFSDFLTYSGGVYTHESGSFMGGHAVKMIGWGTDEVSGEDYWLIANSWNPSWGEGGLFRILRGVNECGIEGQIVAGEV